MVIAALYFGLIALVLMEAGEAYRSAARFRARLVAQSLAESGAELAAQRMLISAGTTAEAECDEGFMKGTYRRLPTDPPSFLIDATGQTRGPVKIVSTIHVEGHFEDSRIVIDRTRHSR